ncbi:MAG: hypothetical protein ACPGWR_01380 [Ardenticatenaceae bacterium]
MTQKKRIRRKPLASRISQRGKKVERLSGVRKRRKPRNLKAKVAQLREERKARKPKRRINPQPKRKEGLDQETIRKIEGCQRDYDNLQDDIMLESTYDDMAKIDRQLDQFPIRLAELRKQGFVFAKGLEDEIDVLDDKWDQIYDDIENRADQERPRLIQEGDRVDRLLDLARDGNERRLARAESAIESLERKIQATRETVRSSYRDIENDVDHIKTQIQQAESAFELMADSKVDFLSTEYLVAACKAKMLDDANDDEGPKGILYLTDQRLLFEQKEEITTKTFLFFFTLESKMVQEVRFASLLGQIETLEAEDKGGFLSSQELLNLDLSPSASRPQITFELEDVENEVWDALIKRVMTGEIEKERIAEGVEEKEELRQKVSQAPTTCPTCGATLEATILRGQTSIRCDYCDALIRL